MSLYQKLTKVMDDRDVEGYVQLIHEDAEIVFPQIRQQIHQK